MPTSNRQLVLETLEAFSAGDLTTVMRNLADDVTWTFFGTHRFAGSFHGKDELSKGLFEVVGSVLKAGIVVQVNAVTAEGDRVIVEAKGHAESHAGLAYNNDYCLVFELADGRIRHVRQYLDSELVTRVFGPR